MIRHCRHWLRMLLLTGSTYVVRGIRSAANLAADVQGTVVCRGTGDFAAKRTIEDKRPEWNNRGHEREQRTAKWPGPRDADPDQDQHEGNEEDAVDAANNANSNRQAGKIFQRHGNEQEDKKRDALNERDETQLTKRSHDHILSGSPDLDDPARQH